MYYVIVVTRRYSIYYYLDVNVKLFCGILDRVCIVSEIFKDAQENQNRFSHQLILGDLNTLAHSIARFSPSYCKDSLRWGSLGYTEAEWWERWILRYGVNDGPNNRFLKGYNLPEQVLKDIRNPGFYDPFHPRKDHTLENHRGWFKGKLDWTLLKGFRVLHQTIGNHDYSASDHKYLLLDVTLDE